jgi:hypothetical protein
MVVVVLTGQMAGLEAVAGLAEPEEPEILLPHHLLKGITAGMALAALLIMVVEAVVALQQLGLHQMLVI